MGLLGNKDAAEVTEFKQVIWPVLTAHKEVGIKQGAFLKDPFVDGFIFGAWTQFRDAPACKNLSDREKIKVIARVDEMITPSWSGIFGLLQLVVAPHPRGRYLKEKNPDWLRGRESGSKYVAWIYGLGDIRRDPEVQAAYEYARMLATDIDRDKQEVKVNEPTHHAVTESLFLNLFERLCSATL